MPGHREDGLPVDGVVGEEAKEAFCLCTQDRDASHGVLHK